MNFEHVLSNKTNYIRNASFKLNKSKKKFDFEILPVYFSNFVIFYDIKIKINYNNKLKFLENLFSSNINSKSQKSYFYKFLIIFFFILLVFFFIFLLLDFWIQNYFSVYNLNFNPTNDVLSFFFNFNLKQINSLKYINSFFLSSIIDFCSFYKFLI